MRPVRRLDEYLGRLQLAPLQVLRLGADLRTATSSRNPGPLLVGLTELRRRLAMAVHESLNQRIVVRHHLRFTGANNLSDQEPEHSKIIREFDGETM